MALDERQGSRARLLTAEKGRHCGSEVEGATAARAQVFHGHWPRLG